MIRSPAPVRTDIVLIGGGHAHVEVLRQFGMRPEAGVRLTLVARDIETAYSGMVPGYFAGHYTFDDCHVDLRPLGVFAGARLVHAPVTGLDLAGQRVFCADRPALRFDLLSIDIGSVPRAADIPGAATHAIPVKPIDGLLAGVSEIESALRRGRDIRLAIIGAGAGGVELALALAYRLRTLDGSRGRVSITLVDAAGEIMPGHAQGARQALARALKKSGIETALGRQVSAIEAGRICRGADDIAFDRAILVTGAGAPGWPAASGLDVDGRGFIRVDWSLRSLSHQQVFAAGDIADFKPRPLPKSGVYAVREGPVLAGNLRRAATGQRLAPWHPQTQTLALVSTGSKRAVASRGRYALSGAAVWWLKDRIDRRWMGKYRDLPDMVAGPVKPGEATQEAMRCGGCGAKIAQPILARVLATLPPQIAPHIVQGLDAPDDAAVLAAPPQGEVLVQTIDQFRAFTDDPYLFGRIAANHCLGDLHAMGADPKSAMAVVMLPHAGADQQEADLTQVLAGAAEVLGEAGAGLVGGHTGEAAEFSFGLALTGHARPDQLTRKSGLAVGDALILTKPLGTGVLFAADMRGKAKGRWIDAAFAVMQRSSAEAARVLCEHGARAVTDVTGFGLAGHLGEMLDASDVDAALNLAVLPVLPGAKELLQKGYASTLAPANAAAAAALFEAPAGAGEAILFDPQTAGGLIAGIPVERAQACLRALRTAGDPQAAIIGTVRARAGQAARVTFFQ